MPLRSFGFIGPTYVDKSPRVSVEECINLVPTIVASDNARKRVVYYGAPGLEPFATLSGDSVRGLVNDDGRLFAVSDTFVEEIASDGTVLSRGTVVDDGGPVQMETNGRSGNQILIRSGRYGYVLDLNTNAVTAIADPDFPSTLSGVVFLDGYFVALEAGTGAISISTEFDGTAWDGTDVGLRQTSADKVIAIAAKNRELWLMGSRTVEVWVNTGNANFPFAPLANSLTHWGVRNKNTIRRINDVLMWVAESDEGGPVVVAAAGYKPEIVSTPAVSLALQDADLDDAEAYSYEEHGHQFYVLSLPTSGLTFVYDVIANLWHKRLGWNASTAQWTVHDSRCHAWCFNEHLIGSRSSGAIYRQSLDVHDYNGSPRRWLRRSPYLGEGADRVYHDRFQLLLEPGVGLTTGAGSDPQAILRYSDDWGRTWSNERPMPMGTRGQYSREVKWYGLGLCEGGRVYEVSGSDAVRVALADAMIDARAA